MIDFSRVGDASENPEFTPGKGISNVRAARDTLPNGRRRVID